MNDKHELEERLYNRPLSVFKINERKVRYIDLLQSGLYEDCDEAVVRMNDIITERMQDIREFIQTSPIPQEDRISFCSLLMKEEKL